MSSEARTTLILALLALCVGLLMLRDWQLQGEIELAHERLDGLGAGVVRTRWPLPATDSEPARSTVARILSAETDDAAEAAAMEAT